MTHHITKPTPLPAVVRWPPSWTGRSNHHFTGTLVQAQLNAGKVGESVILLYFHSKNLLFAKHRPILTSYSFLVFISALVAVHNIEYSYMTSHSIYMRDIKASGPACHPPNHSDVLQSRLTCHPSVAIMTHHITKPTPLPAVVRWPPSWTGRSNHHFTGMLVQALSSLS